MAALLVITTGQTDVQVVLDGKRYKLERKNCGLIQDAIMERPWETVDTPRQVGNGSITGIVDNSAKGMVLGTLSEPTTAKEGSNAEIRQPFFPLPEGRLQLCTPKLDAVLDHIKLPPTAVLILETNREFAEDPRRTGDFVERRLKDLGVQPVIREPFLSGREYLEDISNPMDAVVRRPIVDRLSKAIVKAAEGLGQEDRVFVATTGGFAAVNELVNEMVRLHCVGVSNVSTLEVPDTKTDDREQAVEERFHPAADYRARWQALSLIEKGNWIAAWGAVSHLERNTPKPEWIQVVKWLYLFASSLPFRPPLPRDCGLNVLNHECMAVRAALRVELALRAGDIPRAVHGTISFFEAALWEKLLEHFERSSDPKRRRLFKLKSGEVPPKDKLVRQGDCSQDDRKRPFERVTIGGTDWYRIDDSMICATQLAKHYLDLNGLTTLSQVLNDGIRELRNDIAHEEPTPELMKEARNRMQTAALWSTTDRFLTQPLIQDVLKELGMTDPETLLTNLLNEVRRRFGAS